MNKTSTRREKSLDRATNSETEQSFPNPTLDNQGASANPRRRHASERPILNTSLTLDESIDDEIAEISPQLLKVPTTLQAAKVTPAEHIVKQNEQQQQQLDLQQQQPQIDLQQPQQQQQQADLQQQQQPQQQLDLQQQQQQIDLQQQQQQNQQAGLQEQQPPQQQLYLQQQQQHVGLQQPQQTIHASVQQAAISQAQVPIQVAQQTQSLQSQQTADHQAQTQTVVQQLPAQPIQTQRVIAEIATIQQNQQSAPIIFDEMASLSIPTPDLFRGSRDEDAEEWLRSVEHWCRFKQVVDPQKSAAVPVLLRDSALYWYDTLSEQQKTNFTQFREVFLARYKNESLSGWQDAAAVWNTKQQPGQSVDSFINIMERKTAKANVSQDQKRYAIISGLKPSIRRQVSQHIIESIDDIRRWASIAEASELEEEKHTDISSALKELQSQIKNLHVRAMSPGPQSTERSRRL